MSWMGSGTELSQFLRIFLSTFDVDIFKFQNLILYIYRLYEEWGSVKISNDGVFRH